MDFKVAGNETGITTFQLDIKSEGLTLETLDKALQQVLIRYKLIFSVFSANICQG